MFGVIYIKETIDYRDWIMNNTELDSYYNLVNTWGDREKNLK